MKRLLNKVRKFRDEEDEDMMANNAMVLGAVANYQSQNQPRMRGSHVGRAPNRERFREERGNNLMQDYFIQRSVFSDVQFRTRYRMSHDVFNRIFADLCQYDSYFVQKSDATKKVGLLPQQKMTSSLRMVLQLMLVMSIVEWVNLPQLSRYNNFVEESLLSTQRSTSALPLRMTSGDFSPKLIRGDFQV